MEGALKFVRAATGRQRVVSLASAFQSTAETISSKTAQARALSFANSQVPSSAIQ